MPMKICAPIHLNVIGSMALIENVLWPLFFIYLWAQWFCKTHFKIPFTLHLFRFLPHIQNFSDSAKELKVYRKIALSLPIFILLYLGLKPILSPWFALFALLQVPIPRKKTEQLSYPWNFPNEISKPFHPNYPLLRKTERFCGEKQLEIKREGKPHVIFIFLESFRAKNVGCLGAKIAASPHFDKLSEEGALFSRFYANGLQTFRALIASLFGIPAHLGTMSLHPFCSIPMRGLPEILKENGYHTALIQGGFTTFDWTYPFCKKHGFETILGREHFTDEKATSWGISDEALFNFSADFLQKQTAPTFLSLFTISNHHPWESPIQFPTPEHITGPYSQFLQTFSYSDHCLGQFIEKLKKTGVYEKSVIFIMGDHGQEIGEGNVYSVLHNSLCDENIHVPLLILGAEKTRVDSPSSQVDLLPTVLDLLNIPAIHHSVGKSLLRKSDAPIFISMHQGKNLAGSITKEGKEIVDTLPFFQSVEKIYQDRSWAPALLEKNPFEIKAPPNATNAEWLHFYKTKPFAPIIDLSNTKLTDIALTTLKENATYIHELNLSNSPLFTDQSLQWAANHCAHLSIMNAAHCPLMTDQGASALIDQCPHLRYLSLEGNDEIVELRLKKVSFLSALHLRDCYNFKGGSLGKIAPYLPHLSYLSASFEKTAPSHLDEISSQFNELLYLWLENGVAITDEALSRLVAANPKLMILILENFSQISKVDLSKNRSLTHLKFENCPQLTNETLYSLKDLPIKVLTIRSCPQITDEGLKKIPQDCIVSIL